MPESPDPRAIAAKGHAIRAAGSLSNLARAAGVTRSAVSQWDVIPLDRVLEIERNAGIPREQLRPDFFRDSAAESAA